MDSIIPHVEYLLKRCDCVIVPGLGAFIVSHHPARYEASEGIIFPPAREVCFNASICHNDGLLASSLVRRDGISYDEASRMLERASARFIETLDNEGELSFGSVGIFSRSEGDTPIFSPCRTPLETARLLGMESISLGRKAAEAFAATDREPGFRSDDSHYHIKVSKNFVKVAASLLVVLACCIGVLFPPQIHDSSVMEASLAPVTPKVAVASGTPQKAKETPAEKPVVEEKVVEKETETPSAIAEEMDYLLVVGTFRTMEEATRFVDSRADSGYTLRIDHGKKLCRVYAAASNAKEDLMPTLSDPSFQSRFAQSWIYRKK